MKLLKKVTVTSGESSSKFKTLLRQVENTPKITPQVTGKRLIAFGIQKNRRQTVTVSR